VEVRYSSENIKKLQNIEDVHAVLLMIKGNEIGSIKDLPLPFEVYIDVLFPGSLKKSRF